MLKTLHILVSFIIGLSAAAHVNLEANYPFSKVLFDSEGEYYELHWNFTRSTETIYFAVNVSTTGWVGDRYAEDRSRPPIDTESQDWFLTNSEEENGFTVLEFFRKFTSCDPQDRDIESSTVRVLWSYSRSDPTQSTGSDAAQHDYQGSMNINLIGIASSANRTFRETDEFFDLTVTNVTIPANSTTYWCETFRTPEEFADRIHYITRIAPVITAHTRAYVHHMVVYQCSSPLADEAVGVSLPCENIAPLKSSSVRAALSCRAGLLLGGWTVGGEDIFFPEGVSYPIGGTREALIEIHYDNPDMTEGVIDNSGMRFFFTTQEPEVNAGSIALGHTVTPAIIVPQGVRKFTIAGICSADCTKTGIPTEGIKIFANSFHTHVAGRGVVIEHYRQNTECNVLEQLEPIDQNLNYDFNFQQTSILPKEHLVLPGDILVLKCFYGTSDRTTITQGGFSTMEEMCLSFVYYYPRSELVSCLSEPGEKSYDEFLNLLQRVDPDTREQFTDSDKFSEGFRSVDWASNPELITSLESSVLNSTHNGYCFSTNGVMPAKARVNPGCFYQPPNKCGGPQPMSCCEQVDRGGASCAYISSTVVLFMLFLIIVAN